MTPDPSPEIDYLDLLRRYGRRSVELEIQREVMRGNLQVAKARSVLAECGTSEEEMEKLLTEVFESL